MRLTPLAMAGVVLVEPEPAVDERGLFARTYCRREFEQHGIHGDLVQTSVSWNARRGTLRGLHLQLAPSAEGKLVRCVRGCVVDVVLDLRAHSATYLQHVAIELDAGTRRAIFIPPGCAHGFQTLADDTELLYCMTDYYQPELASGVRWNDPAFGIVWPVPDPILSPRDAGYPDFDSSAWRGQFIPGQEAPPS